MIRLVVTADDFGQAVAVNEAVERAHQEGILTAASLMVAAPAAADAVARARAMPSLGVGLHLVMVEARPLLAPDRIPDLVGADGLFRTDMARFGLDIAVRGTVRRQLRDEIAAQFAAFADTGLPFDHVNAHKHFHVHPVIAGMVIERAVHHGVRAIRAPVERGRPRGVDWFAAPFARSLRTRARRRGMTVPDQVYGLAASGRMDAAALRAAIADLPLGLSEVYSHPATSDDFAGHGPAYRHRDELAGLLDPAARTALVKRGIRLGRFADFAGAGR
ncbi:MULTISPECIES: hopanoid biosynthesis-associated protein HpnK [unclassified Sphingomonas]|uniref:hopanoid biosynthesis-associated protein HpnK n=1 Tax=unclassified Sphingomonas TaxID=196159 RepID=UPI001F571D2C|nr:MULTISPECIES: hopanoid biosynthesis-associated protein HpnK [unclassified Sphingomonas]